MFLTVKITWLPWRLERVVEAVSLAVELGLLNCIKVKVVKLGGCIPGALPSH